MVLVPPAAVGAVGVPVNAGLVNAVALVSFSTLPSPIMVLVMPDTVPVKVGLSIGALSPIAAVTVLAKLASSPRAAASSSRVSSVPGAELIKLATSVLTYWVVAICVVLVPAAAVGAVGVPVNVGLVNIVALDSFVTEPNPTMAAETPETVPVNVGLLNIVALDSFVTLPRPRACALGNTMLSSELSPEPVIEADTELPCVIEPMLSARLTVPALISVLLLRVVMRLPSASTLIPMMLAPSCPEPGGPGGPEGPMGPETNTTRSPSCTVLTAVLRLSTTLTAGVVELNETPEPNVMFFALTVVGLVPAILTLMPACLFVT